MLDIVVVSDATGATAEAVATSALVQFPGAETRVHRFPFTRTPEQVDAVFDAVGDADRMVVVFTLVSRELSDRLLARARRHDITAIDLLGPLMALFSGALNHAPSRTPGAFRGQSEDMFLATEAIHFTLRHDDGAGMDTIDEADLIILGVSRTGKTPTSIYLSCRKLKVANVPIIPDIPLASEVLRAPAAKVGFRIDLDRLVVLRGERFERRRLRQLPGYTDRRHIAAEVRYCDEVFRRIPGLATVDVTNRSIEETSDWITRKVL